jgi:DNA-binding beta-propeller fold protein YncE
MSGRPISHATQAALRVQRFDVFLSHNSRDKATVERIAEKLARAGLEPWLDKWRLTPGRRWQDELAEGLAASSACAVFIGPEDVGAWEREELGVALDRAAKDPSFRLFLVLLPGLAEPFEASALSPFLSTRTWVDFRGGLADTRAFQALVNATKGLPLGPEKPIEPREDVTPYRGLQAFDEEHAEFFFGRDADVQRLLEKLKATSFLAVLGPSGSGKSSLARAGLVPALRREAHAVSQGWTLATFRPGAHPLDTLAGHLLSLYPELAAAAVRDQLAADPRTLRLLSSRPPAGGTRLLCLVDQCEEVFTLCRDEEERRFFLLNLLHAAAAEGPATVLLTLRADFYARCAAYPLLAQQLAAHQFLVGPMDEEGLRQVIEEPVRLVGLELEAGLVDTILEDVQHQPGALPLLEHALLELWERRRGGMLTLEAYRESGGVEGALAKRADAILASLAPDEREIVRRVLLRLTQPGEGAEDTRRRAPMSELVTLPAEGESVETIVRFLADARLLTTGRDEEAGERLIEVSHEALIRGWPQLRLWVEEDRQGLRVHRRLTEAAQEWQRHNRDEGDLLRALRLGEALEWRDRNEADLNELEREFLTASLELANREEQEAEERSKRELEEARRLAAAERRGRRRLMYFATALIAGLLAVGYVTVRAQRAATEAQDRATEAERARELALSREVAATAIAQLPVDPQRSLLLAVEAAHIARTSQARDALRRSLGVIESGPFMRGHDDEVTSVAFTPDGRFVLTTSLDGTVRVWTAARGKLAGVFREVADFPMASAAISPDGKVLVSTSLNGTASVWDFVSRRLVGRLSDADSLTSASFSPDRRLIVTASTDGSVSLWETDTLRRMARLFTRVAVEKAAFNPAGTRLVTAGRDGSLQVWDAANARLVAEASPSTGSAESVSFSPDGQNVVAVNSDESVRVWNFASGQSTSVLPGHEEGEVVSAGLSPGGGALLVTGSIDGTVRVWDLTTGSPIAVMRAHGTVTDVAFSPDGELIATAGSDGSARLYRCTLCMSSIERLLDLAAKRKARELTPEERQKYLHE